MADYGTKEATTKPYRDPYEHLRICRGCHQGLAPVVFQDDTGGHDGVDADGKPYRPFIALWGWCKCDLLKAKDPAGWRRAFGSEYGPEAGAILDSMASPYILKCNTCNTRMFAVAIWEPGAMKWMPAGDRCACTDKREAERADLTTVI